MKYTSSEKLFCVICGKEIEGAGNRLRKFCSYECRYEHIKNTRIKYRACKICGQEFRVQNRYRYLCSDKCKELQNKLNSKTALVKPENREKRRKHAAEFYHTEIGYIKNLQRRIKSEAKSDIDFNDLYNLYKNNHTCYYCGKELQDFTKQKTIDHKIPISRGGTNDINNLVVCCHSCNSGKCDKTDIEYFNYRRLKNYARNKDNNSQV